ncbi:hypothetical protein N7541_005132 [Penicillium brevicompactum]|uniref:Uncharacterized protein n=1 Tax=Penicillium brevicompactum TaxID=5074 RepID=A0A9W9RER9_PENBR|nr:hypothetical protein N7541_005132 [Penicillium brevicompactum]
MAFLISSFPTFVSLLKDHASRASSTQIEHGLFIAGIFSVILYHTRHQVPIYHRKFHKKRIYLYIHIITGLSEAFKYRVKGVRQGHSNTLPDIFDVLSCLIWSWTSFELVKTLRRGDPRTTRPPYQVAACLRPTIATISYLWGIPSLHKVSISSLDSFLWARLVIYFFSYAPYISSFRSSTIYAISIPLASTLSVHESRVPGASFVFVLATAFVTKLNSWTTRQSESLRNYDSSSSILGYKKRLVAVLVRLGFVELKELRKVGTFRELELEVRDDYVPN